MKTNFQMIKDLNKKYDSIDHIRGVVTSKEVDMINDMLCLDDMDVLQLRNLRDFVVLFLSNKKESESDNTDKISAITSVIDNKIFSIGGEV